MYQTNFLTVFMGIVTIVQATSQNLTNDLEFLIIGGKEARPGEFPFIVSIQNIKYLTHSCGGSIIEPEWILTAAHCVDKPDRTYIIKAGKHKMGVTEPGEQYVRVKNIYIHEQYRSNYGPYDIALLKLEKKLQLNNRVRKIALPEHESRPQSSEKLTIVGWGAIGQTRFCANCTRKPIYPNTMQKIDVLSVDLDCCKRRFGNASRYRVVEHNLCTAGISTCWGDSGGPVINVHRQIIGIVSWGYPCCCDVEFPDVNIRVSAFIKWIQNLKTPKPSSSSKLYLAHLFIPLQICSLFMILKFTHSL